MEHRQDSHTADYRLTAAGTELVDLLAELERWAREHWPDDDNHNGQ
ncbi:hypothetical protein EV385_0493 [Krasilnikovia cinnamomea]|uniref:Uncharacterized protein n=1 Tax=Krasilnikovia cinnamomea TaxID=349313 RepID=A0A4Q7ZFJ7_9ACTN|nr:hypothetical protein EV385_0493 [Krasilnikovia cinnamomea]